MKHTSLRLALLFVIAALASPVFALRLTLDAPAEREFILDRANMLDAGDEAAIRAICTGLLREKATPIIVVTIESMAKYGGADMRIETFSTLLFNQWGVGVERVKNEYWNTGIILLVSRDDRAARIELGAGWGRAEDSLALRIMDERIVPRFKQGDFSGGIRAGVESLDRMARQLELPTDPYAPAPDGSGSSGAGGGIASTIGSILMCPLMIIFAVIAFVLKTVRGATGFGGHRHGGWGSSWGGGSGFRSGGGFSSGGGSSFGGGFSRGGGASGRW